MDDVLENNGAYKAPLQRPVIQRAGVSKEEVHYRIKWWMGGALIIVAVLFDLAELLITWIGAVKIGGIISMVLSLVAGFVFWLWYLILGVSGMGNPKQFAVRIGTYIGEIIPFLDAIPLLSWLWTIGMIATIIMVRAEDRERMLAKKIGVGTSVAQKRGGGSLVSNAERLKLDEPKLEPRPSANRDTLDLRNKNNEEQTQKPPQNRDYGEQIRGQQKQERSEGTQNQASVTQKEIATLKSDIQRWKREKQQLEMQAMEKRQKYNKHKKFTSNWINIRKEQGIDENQLRGLMKAQEDTLGRMWSDFDKSNQKINELENILWGANNRLARLEQEGRNRNL